jgi:hypothetical protein
MIAHVAGPPSESVDQHDSPAIPITRRVFVVSRRGGRHKPAVRVVLDARSAAAEHLSRLSPARPGPDG